MNKLLAVLMLCGLLSVAFAALRATPLSAGPEGPRMGSTNYRLDWSAVGEISGGTGSSAHYRLEATISQTAANTASTSASYAACTGWECLLSLRGIYLPLLRR